MCRGLAREDGKCKILANAIGIAWFHYLIFDINNRLGNVSYSLLRPLFCITLHQLSNTQKEWIKNDAFKIYKFSGEASWGKCYFQWRTNDRYPTTSTPVSTMNSLKHLNLTRRNLITKLHSAVVTPSLRNLLWLQSYHFHECLENLASIYFSIHHQPAYCHLESERHSSDFTWSIPSKQ